MKLFNDILLVNINYVISLNIEINSGGFWCVVVKTTDGVEHRIHNFDKYEDAQEQLKKYSEDIFEV
jgi:hypothetical protein